MQILHWLIGSISAEQFGAKRPNKILTAAEMCSSVRQKKYPLKLFAVF